MKDNTPLLLEMVIFDPKSKPDTPPIRTHKIRFHSEEGRMFMNKTAIWAWNAGLAVATKRIDNRSDSR